MRRALFALACVVTLGLAWHFRCRHVNAKRHPLGGFVCPDCLHTSAEIPTLEHPYAHPHRATFDRKHSTITRGYVQ